MCAAMDAGSSGRPSRDPRLRAAAPAAATTPLPSRPHGLQLLQQLQDHPGGTECHPQSTRPSQTELVHTPQRPHGQVAQPSGVSKTSSNEQRPTFAGFQQEAGGLSSALPHEQCIDTSMPPAPARPRGHASCSSDQAAAALEGRDVVRHASSAGTGRSLPMGGAPMASQAASQAAAGRMQPWRPQPVRASPQHPLAIAGLIPLPPQPQHCVRDPADGIPHNCPADGSSAQQPTAGHRWTAMHPSGGHGAEHMTVLPDAPGGPHPEGPCIPDQIRSDQLTCIDSLRSAVPASIMGTPTAARAHLLQDLIQATGMPRNRMSLLKDSVPMVPGGEADLSQHSVQAGVLPTQTTSPSEGGLLQALCLLQARLPPLQAGLSAAKLAQDVHVAGLARNGPPSSRMDGMPIGLEPAAPHAQDAPTLGGSSWQPQHQPPGQPQGQPQGHRQQHAHPVFSEQSPSGADQQAIRGADHTAVILLTSSSDHADVNDGLSVRGKAASPAQQPGISQPVQFPLQPICSPDKPAQPSPMTSDPEARASHVSPWAAPSLLPSTWGAEPLSGSPENQDAMDGAVYEDAGNGHNEFECQGALECPEPSAAATHGDGIAGLPDQPDHPTAARPGSRVQQPSMVTQNQHSSPRRSVDAEATAAGAPHQMVDVVPAAHSHSAAKAGLQGGAAAAGGGPHQMGADNPAELSQSAATAGLRDAAEAAEGARMGQPNAVLELSAGTKLAPRARKNTGRSKGSKNKQPAASQKERSGQADIGYVSVLTILLKLPLSVGQRVVSSVLSHFGLLETDWRASLLSFSMTAARCCLGYPWLDVIMNWFLFKLQTQVWAHAVIEHMHPDSAVKSLKHNCS